MEWIACKDRLPIKSAVYLCVLELEMKEEGGQLNLERVRCYDLVDFFFEFFEGTKSYFAQDLVPYEVSHWMDLPDFPE